MYITSLFSQVCDQGCAALSMLALRKPSNCKDIMESGGALAALQAMKTHPEEVNVQVNTSPWLDVSIAFRYDHPKAQKLQTVDCGTSESAAGECWVKVCVLCCRNSHACCSETWCHDHKISASPFWRWGQKHWLVRPWPLTGTAVTWRKPLSETWAVRWSWENCGLARKEAWVTKNDKICEKRTEQLS